MANVVSAPPGTNILVLDRSDKSVIRIPVVAFDVLNTLAYPVTAIAFRGLVKAEKALELNGFIMDRGFEIPFDSEEAWVQWAMSVKPGSEEPSAAAEQAEEVAAAPKTAAATKPKPAAAVKPRKTFAQKSFWSRTNTEGVQEIVEIEPGEGLPRETEGFEKIKRDEYAAFKKQSKGGDESISIIAWDDGPVIPGSHEEEVIEQEEAAEETEDAEDYGGLV